MHGAAAICAAALAGCLGSDDAEEDAPPEPIALTGGLECDVCGMVIEDHFGPAGQVFYANGGPEGRDGPARFDSASELIVYHGEQLSRGAETSAAFVTDYSSVDYDLEERDGTVYVSRHVDEAAFEDAASLSFVVDSVVHGAMGPDYIPFADPADAEAFANEHAGDVVEWDDLVNDAA